jgi:hypothetical protein
MSIQENLANMPEAKAQAIRAALEKCRQGMKPRTAEQKRARKTQLQKERRAHKRQGQKQAAEEGSASEASQVLDSGGAFYFSPVLQPNVYRSNPS